MTSAVGVCPCEPATGGTTDEWLGLLLLLTGRVDGVFTNRFALDIFRARDVRGGRVPVEPATGGTTDVAGTLGHLLIIKDRVDGVKVVVHARSALRIEAEA